MANALPGMKIAQRILILCIACASASAAHAQTVVPPRVTITFDSLTGDSGDFFSSYAEKGFNVTLIGGQACIAQTFGNPIPDLYGGPSCLIASPNAVIQVTRLDGGQFWFYGADMTSESFPATFTFTGRTNSSTRYVTSGSIAATDDFVFYANTAFGTNISALTITLNAGNAISYNLDNLLLITVMTPEPGTVTMLIAGLLLIGGLVKARPRAA